MDMFRSISLLLSGIAVFLLGIKLMSGALQSGTGRSVKKALARVGDNRFAGVGLGIGATTVTQSSTAVTVMVVGFVNAGVMSLVQAAAIIKGANIGTTLTAFMGAFGAFRISAVFMSFGIVGIFMYMLARKERMRLIGQIITGFALIFIGMELMSLGLRRDPTINAFFTNAFTSVAENPMGPLLLFLLGVIITVIFQSSTAVTMMIVNMASYIRATNPDYATCTCCGVYIAPVISLSAAMLVILGANLGTCLTAIFVSIGASQNAKRAAFIHLSTDIFGFVIFLPILWIFGTQISNALLFISGGNNSFAASFFHLFYNLIVIAILIGFIHPLVRLVTKLIPNKPGELGTEPQLYFIDEKAIPRPMQITAVMPDGTFETPQPDTTAMNTAVDLASPFAKDDVFSEIVNMAQLAHQNLDASLKAVLAGDVKPVEKNTIISTEQKINYINKGIGRHLAKFSNDVVFIENQEIFNSLHHVIFDIERIGDHAMNLLEEAEEMKRNKIVFSEAAVRDLQNMFLTISDMLHLSLDILETRNAERLDDISKFRKQIVDYRRDFGFNHIDRLNKGECSVEAGLHFYVIMSVLERVKDHLTNIAYSVKTTKGTQHEQFKKLSKERIKQRSKDKTVYW